VENELDAKCNKLMLIKDDLKFLDTVDKDDALLDRLIDNLGKYTHIQKAVLVRVRETKALWKTEARAENVIEIYKELKECLGPDSHLANHIQTLLEEQKVELNTLKAKRN